jgi:hypothetical protein
MKPGNRRNATVPIPAGDILRDEESYIISSWKRFFILNTRLLCDLKAYWKC